MSAGTGPERRDRLGPCVPSQQDPSRSKAKHTETMTNRRFRSCWMTGIAALVSLTLVTLAGVPSVRAQGGPLAHLVSDGLTFAPLQIKAEREARITIRNDGDDTAPIVTHRLEGPNASSFALVQRRLPPYLGPGMTGEAEVRFAPRTAGTKRVDLVVGYMTTSDGTGQQVEVRFPVVGIAVDVPAPLVTTPSRPRFSGLVARRLGPERQTQSVELRNRSSGSVHIERLGNEGDEGLRLHTGVGCDDRTLGPGESCTFSVDASIRFAGTFDGQLIVRSDSTHPEIRIPVTASGAFGPDDEVPEMQDMSLPRPVKAYPGTERRIRVSMSWRGRDDELVAGYQAQWRRGSGSWHWFVKQAGPFDPPYSPRTSAAVTVPTGRITFRVRSVDHAGNTSAWMTAAYTIGYKDIRTSNTRRTGRWSTQRVSKSRSVGGSVLVGRRSGSHPSSVTSTFPARVVALVARMTPRSGIARVSSPAHLSRDDAPLYASAIKDLRIVMVEEYSAESTASTWIVQPMSDRGRSAVHLDAWIFIR